MKRQKLFCIFVILAFISGFANASVSFTQTNDEITMEVVNETYTLSTDQNEDILYVAFLDVFLPGGGSVSDSARVSGSATMSVNNGPPTSLVWWSGWQYRPGFQSPWTPEDVSFLFALTPLTLVVGDEITINGTLTMDATADPDIILPDVTGTVSTAIGGHNLYYSNITTTDLSTDASATVTAPVPAIGLPGILGSIVLFGLLAGWVLTRRYV